MRFVFPMFAFLMAFSLSHSVQATEILGSQSVEPGFFSDLQALLRRCAVQPYALTPRGHRVNGNLRSACVGELVVTGASARFALNGVTYVAHLYDSSYSDEGDLNDVRVTDVNGREIASRTNVLAYGDILLALADGNEGIRDEYDASLLP